MSAPRSKNVMVGGREFVVRPLLGAVLKEIQAAPPADNIDGMVSMVAKVLQRTAPDVTEAWLLQHGDSAEYTDVIEALREVTNSKRGASQGEAPAP